jgi:hypothetical protein
MPKPWFVPRIAFGGSIDMGLFLAAASVVLVASQFVQRHQMRRISEKFESKIGEVFSVAFMYTYSNENT